MIPIICVSIYIYIYIYNPSKCHVIVRLLFAQCIWNTLIKRMLEFPVQFATEWYFFVYGLMLNVIF